MAVAAVKRQIVFTEEDFIPIPKRSRIRNVEMTMGAFYIAKENPEKPLGEDAHFINKKNQTFGLADGVGGWSKKGIDGGQYARHLMENAFDLILTQPAGATVDPAVVLEAAYTQTQSKGSSTACIVTLENDGFLYAVNIGDSSFVVIRNGDILIQTKSQQHYFNCPYQLGVSLKCDDPSMADEVFYQVEAGDIVVAGTDGLFDNVYMPEIISVVEKCKKKHKSPTDTARKTAKFALAQSHCAESVSPFSRAAVEAGFDLEKYRGGKYDDITVIVAYVS